MQGTSGLAHLSPVQAGATVATVHLRGQPKLQGAIAPHSASGNVQGLAQLSATSASVKHSGGLRNSNLSEGYSINVTTYAPLPSFLKSARKPRISTHIERRQGLPSLTYRSSSGSSSISSISSMGSEDDKKGGIERRDKDKQQRSTTVKARHHSSDKAAKQCGRSRGDCCKSQRSLSRHRIPNDHLPIRPAVIQTRRQVVLQVEVVNGLKIKRNVINGNLIKHIPLLCKPRFTNAKNALPAHRKPQRQVKSSKS